MPPTPTPTPTPQRKQKDGYTRSVWQNIWNLKTKFLLIRENAFRKREWAIQKFVYTFLIMKKKKKKAILNGSIILKI